LTPEEIVSGPKNPHVPQDTPPRTTKVLLGPRGALRVTTEDRSLEVGFRELQTKGRNDLDVWARGAESGELSSAREKFHNEMKIMSDEE